MESRKLKLCVICCSAFNSASTVESDAVLCREHLVSFCKLLTDSPPRQSAEFDALLQKNFPGMASFFEESSMSVCVDCHHQITVAMDKGNEAAKKEQEVQKLQLEILQKMKELQKQMDQFHEEMTKVEKVIQTSDVSCLMFHMAKNPSKNMDATNGIVLIRDRILDVMTDLRDFQSRQNAILNCEEENSLINPQEVLATELLPEDDDFLPYFAEPDVIIGTEGLKDSAGITPMFFGHTIFTNEGDFRFEASAKAKAKDSDYSENDDELNSSDSDVSTSSKTNVGKNVSSVVSVPSMSCGPPAPSQVRSDSGLKNSYTKINNCSLKKEIINRAQRRKENRNNTDDKSLDPLIKHPLEYDASTDKLTIHGIEILVDECSRTLQCASCGFARRENKRAGGSLDVEWKLKVHVIAAHVGFTCESPGCKFQASDHQQFLKHLRLSHVTHVNNDNRSSNSNHQQPANIKTRSSPRSIPSQVRSSATELAQTQSSSKYRRHHPSSSNVRTCPVLACKKTFARKEDFIRHLQGHRTQNKMQRHRPKPASLKSNSEEPELVILD